jgi:hypothetical protein
LFVHDIPIKSYDSIVMPLFGKNSDLPMSDVSVILLDFEFLRQREKNVLGSSSVLMTVSDWRVQKRSGHGTCHKCDKFGHFLQDYPERQLDRLSTSGADHMTVVIGDDGDVMCVYG